MNLPGQVELEDHLSTHGSTSWRLVCCQRMICLEAELNSKSASLSSIFLFLAIMCSLMAEHPLTGRNSAWQLFVSCLYHVTWPEFIFSLVLAWQLWKGSVLSFYIDLYCNFYFSTSIWLYQGKTVVKWCGCRFYRCMWKSCCRCIIWLWWFTCFSSLINIHRPADPSSTCWHEACSWQ